MTDPVFREVSPAAKLWAELYALCFTRRHHPKLWEAMAELEDEEKYLIDDEAERIIEKFLSAVKSK